MHMHSRTTVARWVMARKLRELRAGRGFNEVITGIRSTQASLARWETPGAGGTVPSPMALDRLLEFYDVDEATRERMFSLRDKARETGWWQAHATDDYGTFIALERGASTISTFEAQLVPGLLQTEAYSRSVSAATRPTEPPEAIEEWLAVRKRRQDDWFGLDDGPHLWAIVWEATLRQRVGGAEVMRAQLDHLRELSNGHRVTLQVLPFTAQAHAALDMGSFVFFHLAEDDLSAVYLAGPGVNLFLDEDRDTELYGDTFDRLRAAALNEAASRRLVAEIARDLRE